jgi:hypothetical protein
MTPHNFYSGELILKLFAETGSHCLQCRVPLENFPMPLIKGVNSPLRDFKSKKIYWLRKVNY